MTIKFPYQIGILGDFGPHISKFEETIRHRFADLSLTDFAILTGPTIGERNRKAPFAAVFFGSPHAATGRHPDLDDALRDSAVVLPIVHDLTKFTSEVPSQLHPINGIQHDPGDPHFERAAGVVLESFRLLRQDRRVFISYKRDDSSHVAAQIYSALDHHGFDVFLDTHGVPPAREFQAVLWHRLADSDVVILLDTPHFYESRWTKEEVARANSTNIQILHVLWPGRAASGASALSSFLDLGAADFPGPQIGPDARLHTDPIGKIVSQVESLRARAMAARHRYLVDAFCDEANRRGMSPAVQPSRHISITGKSGPIVVVPIVGIPSALRLHDVELELGGGGTAWALYDERGLLTDIQDHLQWLNRSLPIRTVSVFEASTRLDAERGP